MKRRGFLSLLAGGAVVGVTGVVPSPVLSVHPFDPSKIAAGAVTARKLAVGSISITQLDYIEIQNAVVGALHVDCSNIPGAIA